MLLPEEMAAVLPPNDHEANEAADAASATAFLDHLQSIMPMQFRRVSSICKFPRKRFVCHQSGVKALFQMKQRTILKLAINIKVCIACHVSYQSPY